MYLLGSPHPILIHTDHSNLQYWKEPRKINQRVARELQELLEYDFILKHIPGSTNTRVDALMQLMHGWPGKTLFWLLSHTTLAAHTVPHFGRLKPLLYHIPFGFVTSLSCP